MPGRPRQVGFAPQPASYSRLPRDDEKLVMRCFARHAAACSTCHISKGDLCAKGYLRARDVEDYIFQKQGRAYSAIDLDAGRNMQVEIPADCGVMKDLFRGMERGLRVRGGKEVKKGEKSYYVPDHRGKEVERKQRGPKYEIAEPKRKHGVPTSSSSSSKKVHATERREHVRPTPYPTAVPTYYSVGPYGPSPVQGFSYGPDPYGYYY